MTTGLMLVVLAGLMNGSFATPMKRIRGWEWEHSWLIWAFAGLIVVPLAAAMATVSSPWDVYANASPASLALVLLFGFVWGVSAILFGLGVARAGLAIGFAVILGISATLGALIPLVSLHPESIFRMTGLLTIGGIALLLTGVSFCAIAGRSREKTLPVGRAGLLICILSGLGAPMINFGLAFGSGIVRSAERMGTPAAHSLNAIWPLLLSTAFLANAGYCVYLMSRKSGWEAFRQPHAAANLGLGALMGFLWMGSNLAYGYGSLRLGPLGLALGWPMMMGCVVLTANGWGAATGEWKDASPRAVRWMVAGVASLLAGVAVIGIAAAV